MFIQSLSSKPVFADTLVCGPLTTPSTPVFLQCIWQEIAFDLHALCLLRSSLSSRPYVTRDPIIIGLALDPNDFHFIKAFILTFTFCLCCFRKIRSNSTR